MPRVSVIIPTYNALAFLPETLDSVFAQGFGDYEVVLVDDESRDGTPEWVRSRKQTRLRLLCQPNQGAAAARNTGINAAQGEYIAFLDADDLWEPDKLARQVALLEERPEVGLVYTGMRVIDRQSRPTGSFHRPTAEGNVWSALVRQNLVYPSSVLVRRSCFAAEGLFDTRLRFAEDWDMWLRLARRYAFAVIPEPLIRYRRHPANKSRRSAQQLDGLLAIVEKAFAGMEAEWQPLKDECRARVYLYLAWKALEQGNPDDAGRFYREGIGRWPALIDDPNTRRLQLAIRLQRVLTPKAYEQVVGIGRRLRMVLGRAT